MLQFVQSIVVNNDTEQLQYLQPYVLLKSYVDINIVCEDEDKAVNERVELANNPSL